MKVLHMIPSIAARDGGPSEAVIHLCRSLASEGLEVDLAYTTSRGEVHDQAGLSSGLRVIELPRFRSEKFKFAPSFWRRVGRHIGDYDLVHVHAIFSYTSMAAARAARSVGRPYVLRPLGSLSPFSLRKSPVRKRLFLYLGMRDLIENAAAIHCTSPREERDVQRMFAVKRTFSLPNGIDERILESASGARELVVLFLGRLDPKKNVAVLIDAFARAANASWRLLVVGEGDPRYEQSLRDDALRSSAAIQFAGWADRERRLELLRTASLFVLPSSDENFGIAAAEAMAAGMPVIVSPEVGLSELVTATGSGWVTAAEPERLASVLRAAMASPEQLRVRGDNGRRTGQTHFRWATIATELHRIYDELTCRDENAIRSG